MKKSLVIKLVITMLVAVCLSAVCSALEVVTVPTFKVKVNNRVVTSTYRDYPLITYKGITYFPMTYNDARFLGISTDWNQSTNTLTISKKYDPNATYYATNRKTKNPTSDYASISTCNIVVNGKKINNRTEQYPILNYRNVTYFPLTWRFAVTEFGWQYSFDNANGLVINSTVSNSTTTNNTTSTSSNFEFKNAQILPDTATTGGKNSDTDDKYRPSYNNGIVRSLSKPTFFIVNFVGDTESSWTQEEMNEFFYTLYDGVDYVKSVCADYGINFDVQYGVYGDSNTPLTYNKAVGKNSFTENCDDAVAYVAKAIGYNSNLDFTKGMQSYSGREQIIHIYAFDKGQTSYASSDNTDDGFENFEFIVFYSGYTGGDKLCASSVAHEIFHLFGAEDLYDPYGKYPNRKIYTDTYYTHDIMNKCYNDVSYNELTEYTKYAIGLTHTPPSIVYDTRWWS